MRVPHYRSMAGLSLVELMISMVIGLVLTLGLIQVMTASRSSYQLSSGIARTQENARFAVDSIQRDVRMAGHLGCTNDQAQMGKLMPSASDTSREGLNLWFLTSAQRDARNFAALSGDNMPLRFDLGIQGFEATGTAPGDSVAIPTGAAVAGSSDKWTPALPSAIAALNPVAGSDIVVVRYLSGDGVPSTFTSGTGTSYTITPATYGKEVSTTDASGLFALSDCKQATVFASSAINAGNGVITVNLTGLNKSGTLGGDDQGALDSPSPPLLYKSEVIVYFVGVGAGGDGAAPPSLYRARGTVSGTGALTFTREEIVEGVESLQLLYGMDEALPNAPARGNVERMYTADTVSGSANPDNDAGDRWRRVGSVQVGLLMRSSERAGAEQSEVAPRLLGTRMLRGATDAQRDTYYRSVYESTIALRNRLFGS